MKYKGQYHNFVGIIFASINFLVKNTLFGGICGAEGTWSAKWVIIDITPNACQRHDECYATYGKTKEECDLDFRNSNHPYGWAVMNPFSDTSQEAYERAQEHCRCQQ